MKISKYKTQLNAYKAAQRACKKQPGSRLVLRLPDGRFTHVGIATGSDIMASVVARVCGGEVVEYTYSWRV